MAIYLKLPIISKNDTRQDFTELLQIFPNVGVLFLHLVVGQSYTMNSVVVMMDQ